MKKIFGSPMLVLGAIAAVVLAPGLAFAGGYLLVNNVGTPYQWNNAVAVPQDIDGGGLGTIAMPDVFAMGAVNVWSAEPTLDLTFGFTVGAMADGDIDTVAEICALATTGNGFSPIVFDTDGSVFAALGFPPGVLGFTFIKNQNDVTFEVTETFQAYNGQFVDGNVGNGELTLGEMSSVITHEMGHALNFDHNQVNGHFFIGDTDDAGFAIYGAPPAGVGVSEIMNPFLLGGGNDTQTPARDDLSTAELIYGDGTQLPGVISGSVFRPDGTTLLQGANVIARNAANPFFDAVAAVSGYLYFPAAPGPGPTPAALQGAYDLRGLTAGALYTVEKVQVNPNYSGGSGVGPVDPPISVGIEEFYNGAGETGDNMTDNPLDFVTLAPNAAGIDIICNFSLALGDDDFEEVPLPFAFSFCGTDYNSVFVGSNGFVTFGGGDTEFIESVPELQAGLPRIAVYWDDFNPAVGGSITAMTVGADFVISWVGVPQFADTDANTFSVTLRADGTFQTSYPALSSTDGIVGVSRGNGIATDPGEIDLSVAIQPIGGTPPDMVYELFLGDADVNMLTLEWQACPDFVFVITPATPGVCYGSTGGGDGGRLFTINIATGATTLIGNLGAIDGAPGLAINSQGDMYCTDRVSGDLYRVDADSGVLFLVGPTFQFMDCIAFDENDVLYGVAFDPPQFNLRRINPNTGATTVVGPTGDIVAGLAFDPTDGQLYGSIGGFQPINADAIVRIDKNTGALTVVGPVGVPGAGVATPAIHFVGPQLYGSKGIGGLSSLVRIDKNTGAGTVVGGMGVASMSGMDSFQPPACCVEVDCPPDILVGNGFGNGSNFDLQFCITNCGMNPSVYNYSFSDDFGWCVEPPGMVNLNPGQTVCITVSCAVPGPTAGGTMNFLRLVAVCEGTTASCATKITVDETVPVEIEGLEALASADGVLLRWRVGRDFDELAGVLVQRAESEAGPYAELTASRLEPRRDMSFQDNNIETGRTYWYRLVTLSADGSSGFAGPLRVDTTFNFRTALQNPVASRTGIEIRYSIGQSSPTRVVIYDVRGRQVRSLRDGGQNTGQHLLTWDRRSDSGAHATSGVYFVQLVTGQERLSKKFLLTN